MTETWVLAAGAAIAGLVQGISGFAFAMVAMSIWVWGVNPQLAAVMAVFGGLTGQIISVMRVRRGWHVSLLWPFVLGSGDRHPDRYPLVAAARPQSLQAGARRDAGRVLFARCWPRPGSRHPERRPAADAAVGLLGGVMAPLSGFSGLAPALWATLRGYTKDEHRAVLQNFNLVVLAHDGLARVWSGRARAEHLPQMGVVAGLAGRALRVGVENLPRLSPIAFRNGVLWVLVFAGLTMLAAALKNMMF